MKKNLSFAFAVMSFAALTMFSSCQKDEAVVTRFEATIAKVSGNSKTVLDGLNLYWVPGDRIKVYDASNNIGVYESTDPAKTSPFDLVNGTVVENSTYRAIYPASAGDNAGRLVLPLDQRTTDGSLTEFPMYADSRTAEPALEFDNLCGVICFKLQKQGVSVSSIEVTTDKQLTGTFTISNNDGLSLSGSTSGSNSVTLTCSTPQSISSQKSFYMYVPANEFKFMRIRIYSNDGHVCTKTLNAAVTTFIVERGKITPLTLNSNNLDFSSVAGELPGLFSIAEGVQVRFSSGNMQYTTVGTHAVAEGGPAGGTWRFAPNQYDYIGKGNENISATYTGWIDLFGWGTSGWSGSGASLYQPYHYNDLGAGGGYNPNDPNGEPVLNNNLTGSYANADWAVYNAISNGGNQPGVWRTLTGAEWTYLINRVGKRGAGSINGVGGIILLPDDWTKPEDCNFTAAFSDEQNVWGPNNYTLAQWAKMEAAGAVFLPAAGYRGIQSQKPYLAFVGSQGYYWSTTRWNNWNAMNYLYFSYKDSNGETLSQQNFNNGLSVRPVRVVPSSQQ